MRIFLQTFLFFITAGLFAQNSEYTIYQKGKGEILQNKYFYLDHYIDDLFIAVPLRDSVDYTYADLTGIINIKEQVKLPFEYRNIEKVRDDYNMYKGAAPLLAISNARSRALYQFNSSGFQSLTDFKYLKFRPYLFDGQYLMAYNGFGQILNLQTKEIIGTKFTELLPVNKDLVIGVEVFGKSGLLNKQGDTILLPIYDRIQPTSEQLLVVQQGQSFGVLDVKGEQVLPIIYSNITLSASTIIAESFQEVKHIEPVYAVEIDQVMDFDMVKQEEECSKPFRYPLNYSKNREFYNLHGAFDFYGNQKIPFEYYYLTKGIFDEIIANKNGKMGVISEDEKVIIDFQYDDITMFFNGLYLVSKGDKQGLFTQNGKKLLEVKYKDIFPMSAHSVLVLENGKWIKVSYESSYKKYTSKKTNLNADYSFAYMDTFNRASSTYEKNTDFFVVLQCSNSGIIDKDLNIVIACEHSEIPRYFNEKYFKFEKTYTIKGVELKQIDLSKDDAQFKGVIIGIKDGKYGVVNDMGDVVVPFEYSYIQCIDEDRFVVKK